MSDSPNYTNGKRALRLSAILVCGIALVLVLPGAPAMAKGTGLGTLLKAMAGKPVPASTGNNGSGKTAQATGASGTSMSSTVVSQPATPSYSPTTMATSSYNQVAMATIPKGSMAMASYNTTTMASAATSPTMMSVPSAGAAFIGHSSGGKRLTSTTTRSWASSGSVWPSAPPAGSTPRSSGKGPTTAKPLALATWPAVDSSASTSPTH